MQAEAQQRTATVPSWVERYLASEPREKFGHAWLRRAADLRLAAQNAEQAGAPAPPPGRYSLKGNYRVAVLAGTFSDVVPRYSPALYHAAFFGASNPDGSYTMRQYFEEVSGGAFTFSGSVTDWIVASRTREYYIDNFSNARRGKWNEYMLEIITRADAGIDWRQYDNDGADGLPNSGDDDGYVDMAVFLHPLADGVCRNDALAGFLATGFRLRYVFGRPFETRSIGINGAPLLVDDFILSAGLHCNGSTIANMNINMHEMGHALGLPDLNDLDRSSYGVGVWDLMGYGLYAEDGRPSHLGAWSRRQLGWARETVVTADRAYTLAPVEDEREILRVNIPNTNEYFLLENRQPRLADASLPAFGLLVWHVDDDVLARSLPGYGGTENEAHPGLAVVQADGLRHLATKSNLGDGGDVFPGQFNRTALTDLTLPGMQGHLGAPSRSAVLDIAFAGTNLTIRVLTETDKLARLDVSPSNPAMPVGRTTQLTVTGKDKLSSTRTTPGLVFSSSAPAVATVDAAGLITPVAVGTSTISATSGEVSATVAVRVVAPLAVAVQTLPPAVLGQQGYRASIAVTGGGSPFKYVVVDPLPPGMALSEAGEVSGDPQQPGVASFNVIVTDAAAQEARALITLATVMPAIAEAAAKDAAAGGPLDETQRRALDLAGNRNGRLDVGDVLLHLKRMRASAGARP